MWLKSILICRRDFGRPPARHFLTDHGKGRRPRGIDQRMSDLERREAKATSEMDVDPFCKAADFG